MIPTRAVREKAAQLLAADAATLAPAVDANVIALVMAAFTPGENLTLGSLTFATFDGATPLEVGVGTQPEGLDPNTNDALISMLPPVTGWRWETTGTTNLPQTIFGYALVTDGLAVLLASDVLETPIVLTAVNQVVILPALAIRQLANSML